MIFADINADVKQQEITDLAAVSCDILQKVP